MLSKYIYENGSPLVNKPKGRSTVKKTKFEQDNNPFKQVKNTIIISDSESSIYSGDI